jgi:hypothetical protein
VHALANARKALNHDGRWQYAFVLSSEERKKFSKGIKRILEGEEGLDALSGRAILDCFKHSLDASKLNKDMQHILFHVDEAARISVSASESPLTNV